MEAPVDCSVLVPVLDEERYIESSVAAMRRQRFDGTLEFVFADGGSTDRTREILRRLADEDPRIRTYDNPRRTVSSGLNVCLRHARGDWALRMDAHTDYPNDYVAQGVRRLRQGGTRWVSGPQVPVGHGPVSRAVAVALSASLGRGGSRKWADQSAGGGDELELDTGVFTGVWERATLLEYGGWDERWRVNEDSEMAARFLERGERLICVPAMGARYVPRDSLRGLWSQYRRYGQFRALTAVHHPTSMRASHLLAPGIALTAVGTVLAPRAVRGLARIGLGGYAVAVASAGVRARREGAESRTAALVPVVLIVMHLGHGTGQIMGWVRYGPPLAAIAQLAGADRFATSLTRATGDVYAPSLSGAEPLSRA
jgi:succinoglycan biosynthesis protein ExoA